MKSVCFLVFFICSIAAAGVVQPLTSAPQLLIPAAGSTPGANGTFFRSNIAIVNLASHDQIVQLRWLPQGGSSNATTTVSIRSLLFLRSDDFVAEILHQSGLGAILVTGVTSSGDLDPTAALYVQTSVWTPQPGTNGTTSQSLPAIPTSVINYSDAALFFVGAPRNGSYRANVGIVNLDPVNEQMFQVTFFFAFVPFTVTFAVPPMAMQQAGLGSSNGNFSELLVANVTAAATKSNSWVAYGSTIDNVTGDALSELAVPGAPLLNIQVPIGKE
jgi:hypothetical protein